MGTKAENLKYIYNRISNAKVLPVYFFEVRNWVDRQREILKEYDNIPWKENVIVRSSSLSEDTDLSSAAGKYTSIPNVKGKHEFAQAVNEVVASYDDHNEKNQILVQPMLTGVRICGVAFTLDPNTLGNYYVINYDEQGSTSAITAGQDCGNRLHYRFKNDIDNCVLDKNDDMDRLCRALRELEKLFGQNNLDVEFAFTDDGSLYILQVRTLCIKGTPINMEIQNNELNRIISKIDRSQSPKPFLCGDTTVYSVMTDWNPAEMIGVRPKPLAMSLYREIITDSVWAYQRDNYGYRNLRSFPLMVDFGGLPYIDVRVSFNSFVPAELEQKLSEKLVNYYIDRLIQNPWKHDKAEFEIVFSCYTLDLPERIKVLKDYGFTDIEIDKLSVALRNITNHIIDHKNGLWRTDYDKIELLGKRYEEIINSDMNKIEKVYWLLEDCKRYGTLPFAGLARAAFIAVQILKSLVACGIFTQEDYEMFMNGVETVSSNINLDFRNLSREAFMEKYGHLRPGTYDICSKRYDEAPDTYFIWNKVSDSGQKKAETFKLSLAQLEKLKTELDNNGLTNDVLELMSFIKTVIEGREYGKFVFTRNLSKVLQLIGEIGIEQGISIEDSSYLNIRAIHDLYISSQGIKSTFMHYIEKGKKDYELTESITLPPIILTSNDVKCFFYPDSEPNYITSGKVTGEIYVLNSMDHIEYLNNKIVLIPSADPGYDWIFSHGIKGLITMYGGANSHMAIRAGELQIPSVIGTGEKLFEQCQQAEILEINAKEKTVRLLR